LKSIRKGKPDEKTPNSYWVRKWGRWVVEAFGEAQTSEATETLAASVIPANAE
jgi:hypothetical protein